ncbi:MAG: hypothetical protein VKO64_02495 [Candidatus Sericytochromatia bacterium]|nr:hypothetical protein [Candidatus Sericytochromatia bacterium]
MRTTRLRASTCSIEAKPLASTHPYLIPGDVLTNDLLAPDTGTVLVPAGTVLNHDAIIRIRSAGLERSTLRLVVAARNAVASGMNLKAFGGKPAGLASTIVQVRAKRIMSTTAGLRALLLLMVLTSAALSALTGLLSLAALSALAFGVLSFVTLSTGSTAQTYTKHLKELRAAERATRLRQQNLEHRAQEGELVAIRELLAEQTLGPELNLALAVGKGWVVAHMLLPDARLLLSPAGLGFNLPAGQGQPPPPAPQASESETDALAPIPEVDDDVVNVPEPVEDERSADTRQGAEVPTAPSESPALMGEKLAGGGHTLRLATGPAIEALYSHAAQTISSVMSASPMTKHVSISFYDACIRTARPKQPYWGCVANFRMGRDHYLEGQRENQLPLYLVRNRNAHLNYERDRPLHEITAVPLVRPTDVLLDPEEEVKLSLLEELAEAEAT